MLHRSFNDPPNPADDPDVLNILCPVDQYVRSQNGHKLPLEMQILLLPMWTLKSLFLDLTFPLQDVATRYMSIRHIMKRIDSSISKQTATLQDIQFIIKEIMKLYESYSTYTTKLLCIRRDLLRHLSLFLANEVPIWENINYLSITDEPTCKINAYCIKISMTEYEQLEDNINEALENCTGIVKSAMMYLSGIFRMVPEIIPDCDVTDLKVDFVSKLPNP